MPNTLYVSGENTNKTFNYEESFNCVRSTGCFVAAFRLPKQTRGLPSEEA